MYYSTIKRIFRLFPRGKGLEPADFCLSSDGAGQIQDFLYWTSHYGKLAFGFKLFKGLPLTDSGVKYSVIGQAVTSVQGAKHVANRLVGFPRRN